jgi:hypothetical protein
VVVLALVVERSRRGRSRSYGDSSSGLHRAISTSQRREESDQSGEKKVRIAEYISIF